MASYSTLILRSKFPAPLFKTPLLRARENKMRLSHHCCLISEKNFIIFEDTHSQKRYQTKHVGEKATQIYRCESFVRRITYIRRKFSSTGYPEHPTLFDVFFLGATS